MNIHFECILSIFMFIHSVCNRFLSPPAKLATIKKVKSSVPYEEIAIWRFPRQRKNVTYRQKVNYDLKWTIRIFMQRRDIFHEVYVFYVGGVYTWFWVLSGCYRGYFQAISLHREVYVLEYKEIYRIHQVFVYPYQAMIGLFEYHHLQQFWMRLYMFLWSFGMLYRVYDRVPHDSDMRFRVLELLRVVRYFRGFRYLKYSQYIFWGGEYGEFPRILFLGYRWYLYWWYLDFCSWVLKEYLFFVKERIYLTYKQNKK